ncbi:MAG: SusE domain-containing protein [Alistipes sp.]|nr:SusE domain-containing protein [Alistipes sp.]
MKNIAIRILLLSVAAAAVLGCSSDLKYKNYDVTPIGGLTLPTDDYFVELVAGDGQFVYFQWEPAKTENGILPSYEVVFYKTKGGQEISRYDAGLASYANISHKDMNKIADLADIDAESEGGDLYWSVIANLGIKQSVSDEVRKLALKRLAGFSYIPDVLYIAGSATEADELEMEMLPMKKTDEDGEFEIYTRLTETTARSIPIPTGLWNMATILSP